MVLCVGSHCKSLWRLNNTFMLLVADGTNAEMFLLGHCMQREPLFVFWSLMSLSLLQNYCQYLKLEMACVSLSIFPLKQVLLFSVFICTVDRMSHMPPSPLGPLRHAAPTLSQPELLHHMGHITLWNPFGGQLDLESLQEGGREREKERERAHLPPLTHTHIHTPHENSGSLVNFSWVTRPVDTLRNKSSRVDSFQVCSDGAYVAMLENISSIHLFSILIATFLSLALWSLELDEASGSSMRFGQRGLLLLFFFFFFLPLSS